MTKKLLLILLTVVLTITAVIILDYNPAEPIGLAALEEKLFGNEEAEPVIEEEEDDIDYENLEISFSHRNHFYDSYQEIIITASIPSAVIYFTTDGSEPTTKSPVYEEPVPLYLPGRRDPVAVYPLKAIAVYEDLITRPLVHTYFLAQDIQDRFDTMVFSLSTNDEYLFDDDTGILVEGTERANFIRDNPRAHIIPPSPANFNWRGMESERPLYIEAFEQDGERVIAQLGGVRVHGGWSRAANQKSLRIVARNMYEPGQGRFRYDFFPDDVKEDGFGSPIRRYDQLILSNNANDRDFGMLRQEVNYSLVLQSGFRVVSPMRAVAIFLNGEYYGFAWLEVRINGQYLQDVYSAPTDEFQIVGRGEWWIDTDDEKDIEDMGIFNEFYNKDFTNDAVLREFEELVDVENLLHYYAYQTYVGNRDWPGGNLRRWRYIGEQQEGLAPELDGRWRYIMYDLDFLMALYEDVSRSNSPSFRDYIRRGNDRHSYMLAALLVRPDMADRFATYICDIASNIVTTANVSAQIKRLYGEAYNEIGYALDAGRYSHWVSQDSIEHNHRNMLVYTREREYLYKQGMVDHFGWANSEYTVTVTGGEAIIGTMVATSSRYFSHLEIPVRPVLSGFTAFDHWILNGEIIDTPEITVSIDDAIDRVVKIELVTKEEYPPLIIREAYGSSDRNGCVLFNPNEEAISTDNLFLTNDLSEPFLWQLPAATVAPGEVLEFAGRGSTHQTDLMKIRMGFNVRLGRTLYLFNENGELLHGLVIS